MVEAIADAGAAAAAILARAGQGRDAAADAPAPDAPAPDREAIAAKHGVLRNMGNPEKEGERCLECGDLCESCAQACPNRANVAIWARGWAKSQIVHVDAMCNECGNCATFCPYESRPYKDKLTLFDSLEGFEDSENQGFLLLDKMGKAIKARLDSGVIEAKMEELPPEWQRMLKTMLADYPYLF